MADLLNPFIVQTHYMGNKSMSINDLPPEAWRIIRGNVVPGQTGKLYQAVPWLFRGVHLRANAVSKMPFVIETLSGAEFDTSKEYKNALGWLPNPRRLLYLTEASLTVEGASYFEIGKGAFTGGTRALFYLNPASIRVHITPDGGIDFFERTVRDGGNPITFQPDEILHTFLLDPYAEVGIGTSPAKAAVAAAGVLNSEDEFVKAFFERGAIKATILTMEGGDSDPGEKKRLLSWWQRVSNGVKGAFASHIVNAKVKPEVIGEGIEALSNQTLTREKREDIGTALGIPHTLLFSDAANYATAEQDDAHFYDKTIVPEADLIAEAINEQVLEPLGYRLRFLPETLDVFQADENERSAAYKNYTDAGMRPSIAVQVLGIELPKGVEPESLDKDWEAKQNQALQIAQMRQSAMGPGNQTPRQQSNATAANSRKPNQTRAIEEDLDRWQRKAIKSIKAGRGAPDFTSDILPAALTFAVQGALELAEDVDAVKAIFDTAMEWEDYA